MDAIGGSATKDSLTAEELERVQNLDDRGVENYEVKAVADLGQADTQAQAHRRSSTTP